MSSGLNSTAAVQLTGSLEQALAAQLPATLVFDMPSIDSIVEYLQEQRLAPPAPATTAGGGAAALQLLAPRVAAAVALAPAPAPAAAAGEPVVLVLATAHRAPGGALECGPAALLGGGDRVRVVPLARWDVEEALGGRGGQPLEAHMRFGAWVGWARGWLGLAASAASAPPPPPLGPPPAPGAALQPQCSVASWLANLAIAHLD
jgi:hypothetical protein